MVGLAGVWLGFFSIIRLVGVWIHQTQNGPLSRRNVDKEGPAWQRVHHDDSGVVKITPLL
jgi:hypothetical protein